MRLCSRRKKSTVELTTMRRAINFKRLVLGSAKVSITRPKVVRDKLMLDPSFCLSPTAPVFLSLSEPAKSTRRTRLICKEKDRSYFFDNKWRLSSINDMVHENNILSDYSVRVWSIKLIEIEPRLCTNHLFECIATILRLSCLNLIILTEFQRQPKTSN